MIGTEIKRAALYARVSTARQAEQDLSLPDQIRQMETYCERRDWTCVETFLEAGASALDDNRPGFQRMVEQAISPERPFDVIVVHSLSRFSRDSLHSEFYVRKLRKVGIEVISITQEISADSTGEVVRKILNVFDEYSSRENAKHTRRAMLENARQGFWNGSRPPFGYRTELRDRRGGKDKKVLVIDEGEAKVIRLIFDLYRGAEGKARGIKAIANYLNERGITQRGTNFGIGRLHELLTSTVYVGNYQFGKTDSRQKVARPVSEWIAVQVPAIIPAEIFDFVQATLRARSPRKTAPRVVTGPTLLTGLTYCGVCGGTMIIATGKSGQYRYYSCSARLRKGGTACSGSRIGMEKLDRKVLDFVADDLLTDDQIKGTVDAFLAHVSEKASGGREKLRQARDDQTDIEAALTRLLALVEKGHMEPDDPALRDRLTQLRMRRTESIGKIQSLEQQNAIGRRDYDPSRLPILAKRLRAALLEGPPEVRKGYIQLFVSKVIVAGAGSMLQGPAMALAKIAAEGLPEPSALVPTFVQKWRPREESNLRPAV